MLGKNQRITECTEEPTGNEHFILCLVIWNSQQLHISRLILWWCGRRYLCVYVTQVLLMSATIMQHYQHASTRDNNIYSKANRPLQLQYNTPKDRTSITSNSWTCCPFYYVHARQRWQLLVKGSVTFSFFLSQVAWEKQLAQLHYRSPQLLCTEERTETCQRSHLSQQSHQAGRRKLDTLKQPSGKALGYCWTGWARVPATLKMQIGWITIETEGLVLWPDLLHDIKTSISYNGNDQTVWISTVLHTWQWEWNGILPSKHIPNRIIILGHRIFADWKCLSENINNHQALCADKTVWCLSAAEATRALLSSFHPHGLTYWVFFLRKFRPSSFLYVQILCSSHSSDVRYIFRRLTVMFRLI